MIEVLALASAVSTVSSSISAGIQAGRDVSSLMPKIGKLGELDGQIQLAEAGKHKGIFGKLMSTEQEALAISQAKQKHKEAMDTLRECMLLFGPPGAWEGFCKELALARARKKKRLEQEAEIRRKRELWIAIALGSALFIGGSYFGIMGFVYYVG